MRVTLLALVVFSLPVLAGDEKKKDDGNPLPKEKWNLSVFETRWGLQLKSLTFKEDAKKPSFTFLFELGQDLPKEKLDDLSKHLTAKQQGVLLMWLYDADDVNILGTGFWGEMQGLLKGKKGERFRFTTQLEPNQLKQTRRIEITLPKEKKEK